MPKQGKLIESEIFYRGPSSRGRLSKYRLRVTWGNPYMEYKKRRWKKLYFKNIVSWEAFAQGYIGKIQDTKSPPRIILQTAVGRRTEEREFGFVFGGFDEWLYFIIRCVLQYSKATIPDQYLIHLPPKLKRKIETQLRLRRFDISHEVFIAVAESLEAGLAARERAGALPEPQGFHPDLVTGEKVAGRTRGGVSYGKIQRKIGKGGSDTAIFRLNQLLEPIVKWNADDSFDKIERPAKPMAVKVPKHNDFDENKSYKDMVREARVLAAIGRHQNIIDLIDAQLVSETRLLLFMEIGDHDMDSYRLDKESPSAPPKPMLIQRYAEGTLAGIAYMHQNRIYHLDMKPANVLICDEIPKIIDFGLSKTRLLDSKEEMLTENWNRRGTVLYQAPECWVDQAVSNENSLAKLDSYAVGMTLFIGLLGPKYKWKRPLHGIDPNREGPRTIIPRIRYFQELVEDEANIRKLKKDGLYGIAKAAGGLIDENPETRLLVEQALELVQKDLNELRLSSRGRSAQAARRGRNPSKRRPLPENARPSWRCRVCTRSFTFRPMRCTCGVTVHPDCDPLFVKEVLN